MTIRKPMKGEDFVESELKFPYYASPKLDGFRGFVDGGILRTSSGAAIGNDFAREFLSHERFEGLDGELIVGAWNDPKAFKNTSGPVRKKTGEPDFRFYVFDDRTVPTQTFTSRLHHFQRRVSVEQSRHKVPAHARIEVVPQVLITDREKLAAFERSVILSGFEGVMLTDPEGQYKFGRSTVLENLRLKVKRFINEEATIIGFVEQQRSTGESHRNEVGKSIKVKSKDTREGTGMVAAFVVRSNRWAVDFEIQATSLTHAERKEALEKFGELYEGKLARFKYFPHGVVDRPRHALFEGIRGQEDMSE
jgi:DNA ligase 1